MQYVPYNARQYPPVVVHGVDCMALVFKVAAAYCPLYGQQGDAYLEELVSAGLLGLAKARKRYRRGRGTQFSTYAHHWIRGAIQEVVRTEARRQKRYNPVELEEAVTVPAPDGLEGNIATRQAWRAVWGVALRELPTVQLAIMRGLAAGRAQGEMEAELGICATTLTRQKRYAFTYLRGRVARGPEVQQWVW